MPPARAETPSFEQASTPREPEERAGCVLTIDLKPDMSEAALAARLALKSRASRSHRLAKAGLSPVAIGLMREAGELPADAEGLAARAKACVLPVAGVAGLARAISSAGGVRWSALDAGYMLNALPGVFVAGEMIDWEAPTGGYLLQGCFSTGVAAARGALAWLARG
jgi:predicted flavoprotein YhiN